MRLLPGLVLLVYAAAYLVPEIRLRRRSRWERGVLDSFRWQVLIAPFVIYLVAAVILSTASWQILQLDSALIVLVLPGAVGLAWLALDEDRPLRQGVAVSATLSLIGLVAVWLGR